MDALKKFFPLSFSKAGSTNDLVVGIIIYVVIGLVAGVVVDISYGFIDPRIRMGSKK